jgi:addiction module HigA family antidote
MLRLNNPSHPGQFIKMEIIEPLGLSVTTAAKVLGVARPTLSALLDQRSALSPEMALRIEKAFGIKMDTLVRMQTAFDIAQTRRKEAEIKVNPYLPVNQDTSADGAG